jgi:hypothetical protein
MAIVVITVQDTENGAVVSLASEPQMSMSAPPAGQAQELAHLMLAALPVNAPQEEAAPAAVQEEATSAAAEVQFVPV